MLAMYNAKIKIIYIMYNTKQIDVYHEQYKNNDVYKATT